jgi:hypothetical protein
MITIVTKEEEKRRKKRHQLLSPFCIETPSNYGLVCRLFVKGTSDT